MEFCTDHLIQRDCSLIYVLSFGVWHRYYSIAFGSDGKTTRKLIVQYKKVCLVMRSFPAPTDINLALLCDEEE